VDAYRDVIHRHGASAAEKLIRSIAHVLAKRLQPNTTLARMGGDEFAAVLRGATPQHAQNLADELCTAVREQSHATGSSPLHATISIGGAFLDASTQTHHEALLAADTALYKAKAAGGDRAILHQSSQDAQGYLRQAGSLNGADARSQDEPTADARRDPAHRRRARRR
jgi:diguanylate cyclase (GGDEF)-like protein